MKGIKFRIQCPVDKKPTYLKSGKLSQELTINYSILNGVNSLLEEKQDAKFNTRYCRVGGHTGEKINFYCNTHSQFLCQVCLLQGGHLSSGCVVKPASEMIAHKIMETESKDLIERVDMKIDDLLGTQMQAQMVYDGCIGNFEMMKKQVLALIEDDSEDFLDKFKSSWEKERARTRKMVDELRQQKKAMEQSY
mmetsp:Transcript_24801/g.38597  ORF Transcript_24801/g.38597 Transcript_24801/m.38597 type:complete len:193 (+) Transcript_24801:520-1098(+)|eukprot:CAMPEP_0170503914 /NCGR_PEP_ID=MMETSP0208-20121228/46331_1 /TAXON_ID=197538 /ORGANISM="Strombidium inclinatum, Strain S3" /LENGTH=192 /DNA_ID=CAMNT_0010783845 /DNA_START=420 /DNA_END=998 /DNA_ORIENTATION=+